MKGFTSGLSAPLHWCGAYSISIPVLMPVALEQVLKSGSISPPTLFFFFKMALALLRPLHFHKNPKIWEDRTSHITTGHEPRSWYPGWEGQIWASNDTSRKVCVRTVVGRRVCNQLSSGYLLVGLSNRAWCLWRGLVSLSDMTHRSPPPSCPSPMGHNMEVRCIKKRVTEDQVFMGLPEDGTDVSAHGLFPPYKRVRP